MSAHQRIRNTQRPQLESCKSSMSDVHMVEGGRYLWGGGGGGRRSNEGFIWRPPWMRRQEFQDRSDEDAG